MGLGAGNVLAWGAVWPLVNETGILYWLVSMILLVGRLLCRLGVGALFTWMRTTSVVSPASGEKSWITYHPRSRGCLWRKNQSKGIIVLLSCRPLPPRGTVHWAVTWAWVLRSRSWETKIQQLQETIFSFLFFPASACKIGIRSLS